MEGCLVKTVTPIISISTPTADESDYLNSHSPPMSQLSPTSVLAHPVAGQPVVLSPCAACKILRRRCAEKCVLAPYFPPTHPHKFAIAHRVFGASNIIKLLQDLPEFRRADAVSSMVYEANARLRDPVYGCAGTICQLQKQVNELQAELAKAHAEMVNLQCRHSNILALVRMQIEQLPQQNLCENLTFCFDDNVNLASLDLWT